MEARIDQFGRIVIPKIMRDHLGLKVGSVLTFEESDHELILKLVDQKPLIKNKGGVMVYTGDASENIEDFIQNERHNRLKDIEDQ